MLIIQKNSFTKILIIFTYICWEHWLCKIFYYNWQCCHLSQLWVIFPWIPDTKYFNTLERILFPVFWARIIIQRWRIKNSAWLSDILWHSRQTKDDSFTFCFKYKQNKGKCQKMTLMKMTEIWKPLRGTVSQSYIVTSD